MARFKKIFDRRFRGKWLNYIAQSVMAAVAILIVLVTLHQQNLLVVASLAATAFTIFIMPHNVTASMRNVVGGHVIGMLFGSLFAVITIESGMGQDLLYALAVGCSTFVMAITNTEHPPAAGTYPGCSYCRIFSTVNYRYCCGCWNTYNSSLAFKTYAG
jgi:CBS-domain-containing membrane protein